MKTATIIAAFILSGCVSFLAPPFAVTETQCDYKDGTLHLSGDTDASMLACVRKHAESSVDRLYLWSDGGDVKTAMTVGNIIAE